MQLMQDRFPQCSSELSIIDINTEIEDLHQPLEETLSAYYKRARSMIEHEGATLVNGLKPPPALPKLRAHMQTRFFP